MGAGRSGSPTASWPLVCRPGDRVGVLEDNAIEAQDFFAGAAAAGLVRVPLYARNSADSHLHMLGHTVVGGSS